MADIVITVRRSFSPDVTFTLRFFKDDDVARQLREVKSNMSRVYGIDFDSLDHKDMSSLSGNEEYWVFELP